MLVSQNNINSFLPYECSYYFTTQKIRELKRILDFGIGVTILWDYLKALDAF